MKCDYRCPWHGNRGSLGLLGRCQLNFAIEFTTDPDETDKCRDPERRILKMKELLGLEI